MDSDDNRFWNIKHDIIQILALLEYGGIAISHTIAGTDDVWYHNH